MTLPLWAEAPAQAAVNSAASGVRLRRDDELEPIAPLAMFNIRSARYLPYSLATGGVRATYQKCQVGDLDLGFAQAACSVVHYVLRALLAAR